jgi:hypothetical protein
MALKNIHSLLYAIFRIILTVFIAKEKMATSSWIGHNAATDWTKLVTVFIGNLWQSRVNITYMTNNTCKR